MNPGEENDLSRARINELPRGSLIVRLILIAVIVGGIALLFAYAGGWFMPHRLSPRVMINTFQEVNGVHPGFRRNHAKGVCVNGYFESNGRGVEFSKASVFPPGRVPIIGRFAFAGGNPFVADDPHIVRSLAILFKLPGGQEWRTAMINIPIFPVKTPQAFHDQLLATAPDPATGKPDPERVKAFLAKDPETAKAMEVIKKHPMSSGFDNSTYYGLNAFRFINANGNVVPVRWSVVPVQPFEPIRSEGGSRTNKNYLFDALIASVHQHPLQWRFIITIGQPGDPTDDARRPWPQDRRQIDVGTLVIDHIESEDTSPARDINFDPLILPNGIAASDDPLLSARSAAYSKSFIRREGEHKQPSAVSTVETER
jgi:catalase